MVARSFTVSASARISSPSDANERGHRPASVAQAVGCYRTSECSREWHTVKSETAADGYNHARDVTSTGPAGRWWCRRGRCARARRCRRYSKSQFLQVMSLPGRNALPSGRGGKRSEIDSWDLIQSVPEPRSLGVCRRPSASGPAMQSEQPLR
jgi:hypothetical protein